MAIQTYIISKKQSLLDACIQVYGTSKLLYQFAKDNGLQIDSSVNIGDSLLYDDELGDADLKNKIEGEAFIINNPGIVLLPETIALIDRMNVRPSIKRTFLINKTIGDLISFGLWDKLDVFYFFNAHDQQASNLNWKSINYTAIPVNVPLFTKDLGYTGDDVTAYINTQYIPSSAPSWTLNSAYFGHSTVNKGVSVSVNLNGMFDDGTTTVSNCYRNDVNNFRVALNCFPTSVFSTNIPSYHSLNRAASDRLRFYLNGILHSTPPVSSIAVGSLPIYLLAWNNSGTAGFFGDQTIDMIQLGGSLIDIEVLNLNSIIKYYSDNL